MVNVLSISDFFRSQFCTAYLATWFRLSCATNFNFCKQTYEVYASAIRERRSLRRRRGASTEATALDAQGGRQHDASAHAAADSSFGGQCRLFYSILVRSPSSRMRCCLMRCCLTSSAWVFRQRATRPFKLRTPRSAQYIIVMYLGGAARHTMAQICTYAARILLTQDVDAAN